VDTIEDTLSNKTVGGHNRRYTVKSSRLSTQKDKGQLIPTFYKTPTTILNAPFFSSIHATCPAHLILLDVITRKKKLKIIDIRKWIEVGGPAVGVGVYANGALSSESVT
jgi:hypothetical protein